MLLSPSIDTDGLKVLLRRAIAEITETAESSESCQHSLLASTHDIYLFVSAFFLFSVQRKTLNNGVFYLPRIFKCIWLKLYGFQRQNKKLIIVNYCEYSHHLGLGSSVYTTIQMWFKMVCFDHNHNKYVDIFHWKTFHFRLIEILSQQLMNHMKHNLNEVHTLSISIICKYLRQLRH